MAYVRLSLVATLTATLAACSGDDGAATATMGTGDDSSGDTGGGSTTTVDDSTGGPDGTGDADSTGSTGEPLPDPLAPLSAAPLTTEERIIPVMPAPPDKIGDPRVPDDIASELADGFGDYEIGPGEPILDVTLTGDPPTDAGPGASMLVRFVHLADTQLADDEAPTRVVALDDGIDGSFRPQEHLACNLVDAAVRTINRVNEDLPLSFVVLGGDNVDNAQTNEVEWFLGVMDGAPVVHCDSGEDNDPIEGPGNDAKDPFAPVGLDVPWYWVTGNHDVEVQGNFTVESRFSAAIGDNAPGGTRDWTMPGGPVITGKIIADEGRALVEQDSLLDLIAASGDGHGITDEVKARGEANYTFDVDGTDLRFVVLDTSAPIDGGSTGLIRDAEVDSFIRPSLDDAEADGKIVVLVSHHAPSTLAGVDADALDQTEFQAILGEYDNVLMHLVGHSHVHAARLVEPMGGTAYWEVITSALMDFPNQMRVIEIHDQDNGEYRIQMVSLDYQTEDDARGGEARALQILDMTTGWTSDSSGDLEDRNVSLYLPVP